MIRDTQYTWESLEHGDLDLVSSMIAGRSFTIDVVQPCKMLDLTRLLIVLSAAALFALVLSSPTNFEPHVSHQLVLQRKEHRHPWRRDSIHLGSQQKVFGWFVNVEVGNQQVSFLVDR